MKPASVGSLAFPRLMRSMSSPAVGLPTLSLNLYAFNHAERRVSWHDPRQAKTGGFVKLAKLLFSAFPAAGHHQHVQVDELGEVLFSSGRDDGFN